MISEEGRLIDREGDEGNCSPVGEGVFAGIVVADGDGVGYGDACFPIGLGVDISGIAGVEVVEVAVGDNDDGIAFGGEVEVVDEGLKTPRNRSS